MTQGEGRASIGRQVGAGGGTADKLGNRYELALAVHEALRCLQDERRHITLEDLDPELADGSEFTLVDEHGVTTVTQVKRQKSASDRWTVSALQRLGIFDSAARHIEAGRRYVFSSMTPASQLRVLCEWSRQSANVSEFLTRQLTKELTPTFDELAAPRVFGTAVRAWQMLRGMRFEVQDEDRLSATNAIIAATLLEGAEQSVIPIVIGSVLIDSLHVRLGRRELLRALAQHGIEPLNAAASRTAYDEVKSATSRWLMGVERELLTPRIIREEETQLRNSLETSRLTIVVGSAGGGKSSVVEAVVRQCDDEGLEVLAFRLDRLDRLTSTVGLGRDLGLSMSPVVALRMAAGDRPSVLIIDQIDAVSLASGRLSESFDVVAELVEEAHSASNMHVVLACRLFDVENDHRIRKLVEDKDARRIAVDPLSDEVVLKAVGALGLDAASLSPAQVSLLKSPLNLVLLRAVAARSEALEFASRRSLFDAFWNWKQRAARTHHPEVRFEETLSLIASAASDRQTLSIPIETVDYRGYRHDAEVLASEQLIAIDDGHVSFFHETFFDYTFARQWLNRGKKLIDFLTEQEQELFRRAQVRQILELLRDLDQERFHREIRDAATSPRIRFHIKETIVSVFASIQTPTSPDLDLFLDLVVDQPNLAPHLWRQITRPSWFGLLLDRGLITEWIDSDIQTNRDRGATWLAAAGPERGAAVARVLHDRRQAPEFARWLSWVAQRTELHLNRPIFELILDAVRTGTTNPESADFWLPMHDLATQEPLWAIEIVRTALGDHPHALDPCENGEIRFLKTRDYSFSQLIQTSSESEPEAFVVAIIPILLLVMRTTELDGPPEHLRYDHHYGFRWPESRSDDIDDVLYESAAKALVSLARTQPGTVRTVLQALADDEHHAAQALLFRTLTSSPEPFVDWAAQLVLEGGNRLQVGYASDSHWLSRELVRSIAPLVSDSTHMALEDLLRDLRDPHEHGHSFGYTAFKFLTALDAQRLSSTGKRRLAEYRRKFKRLEPEPATGITSYSVGSPIDNSAAQHMSDQQWLQAIAKYDNDERDGPEPSVGGAAELAQVLRQRTTADPIRFCQLAKSFGPTTNAAYPSAVLLGLGDANIASGTASAVFETIRHIARLELADNDRWLGWSVRNLLEDTPLDIVEILCQRAVETDQLTQLSSDERSLRGLLNHGINTARGSLAESLGDLLVHDLDGSRTAVVTPHLKTLARDPDLGVRTCVAHTIAACLRHDRAAAYAAFSALIETDDIVLATGPVQRLMNYIGNVDPELIDPVIDRMISSTDPDTRHSGGMLGAFAATEWERPRLMQRIFDSAPEVRAGAASLCAARVSRAADSAPLIAALARLAHDPEEQVRKAVAEIAHELRDKPLEPLRELLQGLIASPSYIHATPQLLIVLQNSKDKVDDLVDRAAHAFLDAHRQEVSDIRTGAAADAHYIADLVVRGLAQATDAKRVSSLLDILDRLVELGGYGVDRAIESVDRA
ncbi:hypothetical protein EDF27_3790 [Curtobacterium sp. PhB136]|nr:hypothetical protein EDF27_3790 [Curtobacterium sp. PhB136]